VTDTTEQILEVEFDKAVDQSDFAVLPDLIKAINIHDALWELTFSTATDRRSDVFDFAQNKGLKTLQIALKNKNLEQIFREKTAKKQ